jgi:site-specific DNA recombinase
MKATTANQTTAVYARFSSDVQKDISIEDQFSVCRILAKREKLTIVTTFEDRAKSGASMFDRDGLISMMAAAKRGDFQNIIVESLDRLSRDTEDLPGIFKRLTYYGVTIHTVSEGVATAMHIGIRGITGSLFLKDLSQKVHRGARGRVAAGMVPGSLKFGYRLVSNKPGEREIDPAQADVVRRIYREYANRVSPRSIAIGLAKDGILSPTGNATWNFQTILGGSYAQGIIGNSIYIGEIVWNKTHNRMNPDSGRATKLVADIADHVVTKVPHLRIIDQTLWDAAIAVRKLRAVQAFGPEGKKTARRNVVPRSEHLLAGLLKCAACGGPMRFSHGSPESPLASCVNAHLKFSCDHRKTYSANKLRDAVLDGMREHLTDPTALLEATRAFHAEWKKQAKDSQADRVASTQKLNRVQVQIDRIVAAITDSDQPVKELATRLSALESERAGLTERLRMMKGDDNVVTLHPGIVDAYKLNVERLHSALSDNRFTIENKVAFRNLIDSIAVHPTGKRMPYEFTPYGRLSAIMGIELFPAVRSPKQIVESDRGLTTAIAAGLS